MAIASNTFLTYSAKGIREDLSNVIYNISPEETPFVSNIGKGSIANTLFDWQTDALAAAAANAQLEGDETSYDAVAATVRLQNYAQISRKSVVTASLQAFLKTNTNKASDGTDPVYTTIPTDPRNDGTQRAFTEAILKDVIQQVWTEGGTPKMLLVGPVNKAKVSAFAGIAASRFNVDGAKPSTIIAAADIYVSDFGNVSIVPSRFQRERDAFILDGEYASIDYLRPMQTVDMAKTGDAEKKLLLCEWALRIHTEVAHGGAFDLTTS